MDLKWRLWSSVSIYALVDVLKMFGVELDFGFATNIVYVRRALPSEYQGHDVDPDQDVYGIFDEEGEMCVMTQGSIEFAFNVARQNECEPMWVH